MFRENVLTDEGIIRLVAETMVPVALDHRRLQDTDTPEAQFLLPLMKQRDQDQGVWIFAPDGKALGGFVGFGDMAGQTRKTIEEALEAFGPVERREAEPEPLHPYRGRGTMHDGSVCLAEYVLSSREASRFQNARSPIVSSVVLTREELASFAPAAVEPGLRWIVPEATVRKLARITSPLCFQHAPQPDWVTNVCIEARVMSLADDTARICYSGEIASTHRVGREAISIQRAKLSGEGSFNVETGKMQYLLLLGSGQLQWPEAPEKVVDFQALVEWEDVR
jgi:hypothetical protein